MKKTRIYAIALIIFGLIITSVLVANGTDEIRAELSSPQTELKAGQEVIVTLKFDGYSKIGKGINAFKATLYYDENVFEKVEETNFQTKNNWEELKYNEGTKEFVAIKKSRSKEPEDVVQITLKVKGDTTAEKTAIKINDIVTSEGTADISMANIELSIGKEEETISGKLGDTDGNGKITTKDAKMVLQHIVKKITLTPDQINRADTDKNKKITTKDAKMILQHIVKKIDLSEFE